MILPDFGQTLWRSGKRQHDMLILIMRYAELVDGRVSRLVYGHIRTEPTDLAPDGLFTITVRTRQTVHQIRQAVAAGTSECAVQGFLWPAFVQGTGERGPWEAYRPIIGRVGIRGPLHRALQRGQSVQAG